LTQDDVVEHLDLEQLPGADQVVRHPDVRLAGLGISATMMVHHHDGVGGDCRQPNIRHQSSSLSTTLDPIQPVRTTLSGFLPRLRTEFNFSHRGQRQRRLVRILGNRPMVAANQAGHRKRVWLPLHWKGEGPLLEWRPSWNMNAAAGT
jgi:hypothetical protein